MNMPYSQTPKTYLRTLVAHIHNGVCAGGMAQTVKNAVMNVLRHVPYAGGYSCEHMMQKTAILETMRAARRAVLLGGVVILFSAPLFTYAATLSIDTDNATYGLSDTFIATVRLDNEDECVNAAHVELSYPTDTLRAVDFSRGSSIFTLWVEEPTIDPEKGTVLFSGGVPGGYCGRIPGDPVLSNVLGKVVFTVIDSAKDDATIALASGSSVYLNDGRGTEAALGRSSKTLNIVDTPTLSENPWLSEVQADIIPPDAFTVHIESTRGVFGGRYYLVFSTVDKQSGLDHFELFERGSWRQVTSPYQLKDQFLPETIQLRAIDKAGNERLGEYNKNDAPPRQFSIWSAIPIILLLVLGIIGTLALLGLAGRYVYRHKEGVSRRYGDTR